jgi:hypothetical protein
VRRFEGLWPFDRSFLTPLAAGGVAAGAMWLVRLALPTLPAVVVGTAVGLATYVAVLAVLGVDPRDRLVVRELVAAYRERLPG